jgi:hypothetical protein
MTIRYTRAELAGLVAARYGQSEGTGPDAFLDLRIKVTPELLEKMLGGYWIATDGSRAEFMGVSIDQNGYAEPIFARVETVR